ncbi:DEAD/DEAH box helicase [Vibrio sp. ZSDZ65]|uniref:DEAD/DEAH box helicase n=1 Tax=Vibrio qingdaonensis TaxID=2829491 RepID=A0A9X3CJQ6_9VIBR|nr:helicase-related protein [Vibrio qingdaonensis]MCW8344718.1 DEAD/DEAH box helicase [Vibrio qingdaonensis]
MISLPIDSIETEFKQLLTQHDLVVEAETGSGKSTRLPLWAMTQGRVLVVEPRRIACTSLAGFVAETLSEKVGVSVGYAIKLETCYQDSSRVVFVTPGVALRWFAENQLAGFDIVIIDEFHERRWDTDLLVALLKQAQSHRTVITSATIEGEKLAGYFGAQRLVAQGRHYDVTLQHVRTDSRQLPDSRDLEQRIKETVERYWPTLNGDVLVFLPGRKEIQQTASMLRSIAEQYDILIAPLYAAVTDTERVLAMTKQAKRKIVLATNVAETSLTIPNIELVIDSGLERRNVQRNGRTTLMLSHISKASAKQRSGRAGRVMNGQCVRLYGEHAALAAVTPPELQRESVVEPALVAAVCGQSLERLDFIDAIPVKSLEQASQHLTELGVINEFGITEHGRQLAPLPVDTLYAHLIAKMPTNALKEAMIDLTAALCTTGNVYQLSRNEEVLEALDKQEPRGCDATLLVGLVRGKVFNGITINAEALKEAQGLSQQMRDVFKLPAREVASRYDISEWILASIQANSELLFVRRKRRKDALGNGDMEVLLGRQSRLKPNSEGALVFSIHSLPGRGVRETMNLATAVMPVSMRLIELSGVGQWQTKETVNTEHGLKNLDELQYAGRVITTRLSEPEDGSALTMMVNAIMSKTVFPALAQRIKSELQHWQLYQELGLAEHKKVASAITVEQWLFDSLSSLGVESMSDLELLDDGDFIVEGIPNWEYQDFAARFPLIIQLSGLKLDVEYFGRSKLVQVHFNGGSRKADPMRKELPAWQGWRVRYKKASRVIDLR